MMIGENFDQTHQESDMPSFLSLLKIHDHLNELFLSHQEALLSLDLTLTTELLRQFEAELRAHMRMEEEILLPVYQRAGRIQGGPVEFFTGEHKRMLEAISHIKEHLSRLTSDQPDLKREIIKLFDMEAMFKSLVEHHDSREENIFYPTLDKVTDEQERKELLIEISRFSRL
jgi:hemerythrin-like domain-containing protein